MITVYNSQNYAQSWFLEKAFAELKASGKLTPDEQSVGRFTSLDGYFAHMGDLIAINPSYTLIPSDEEPCVIDANARSITLPKTFATCGGVVGDTMSEIVTFTIDRYFDYVDLATTNICIQWTTPDKQEGISHISLIDLETVPGKMRFGWPITAEMTKVAGNLEFAVRCFNVSTKDQKVVYIFNTTPAKLPIKAGLNIKGTAIDASGLFEEFVENSINPSYAIPAPVFFTSGDLKTLAKINEHDELTLAAYANVADNGNIDYKWYFKSGATPETAEDVEAKELEFGIGDFYVVSEQYIPFNPQPTSRQGSIQYFIADPDNGANAYKLWTEKDLSSEYIYYYRTTSLRLKKSTEINNEEISKKVTGIYYVGARNSTGSGMIDNTITLDNGQTITVQIPGFNTTPEVMSTHCYLPLPADVTVAELPADKFLDAKTGKALLNLDASVDNGNPTRTFAWYMSTLSAEVDASDILAGNAEKIEVSTPGWYCGFVISELNRTEKDAQSAVCRVIHEPQKPTLTLTYKVQDNDDFVVLNDDGVIHSGGLGQDITLKVTPSINPESDPLLTDELKYKWFVQTPDSSSWREITESDKGESSFLLPEAALNTSELAIQCAEHGQDVKGYGFYCQVTNVLAEHTAVTDLADYSIFFIVK